MILKYGSLALILSRFKLIAYYTKAEDLREYLNLTAIRGEVVVQFWLRPGDETVELSFGWSSGNDSLPGALEGLF